MTALRSALSAATERLQAAGVESAEHDARALALRAPALGEDRLYRIVHQIITESLDAGGISQQ